MIQNMERFTRKATSPDNNTRAWVSRGVRSRERDIAEEGGGGREREVKERRERKA